MPSNPSAVYYVQCTYSVAFTRTTHWSHINNYVADLCLTISRAFAAVSTQCTPEDRSSVSFALFTTLQMSTHLYSHPMSSLLCVLHISLDLCLYNTTCKLKPPIYIIVPMGVYNVIASNSIYSIFSTAIKKI